MEVDLHKLKVNDPFLGQYQQLVRDVVIPYQWDALNDRIAEAEPSHAIENFRIAAGQQVIVSEARCGTGKNRRRGD